MLTGDSFVEEKRYSVVALGDSSLCSLKLLGVVISGDVATAGLDISSVKYVFSNEIPPSLLSLYQRMGRCGRSENASYSSLFVSV